jgi:cytochrome bd-type quinol oxidase subunit 2
MSKTIKQIFIILVLVFILILPYFVFAADGPLNKLQNIAGQGGYTVNTTGDEYKFSEILGLVVSGFLSLLGVIFIGEIIYAGYNWMTARGDEQKIEKAHDTIRRAIIGLVVVVGAYAIWAFVYQYLLSSSD